MPEEASAPVLLLWAQASGSHCTWYRLTPGSVRSEQRESTVCGHVPHRPLLLNREPTGRNTQVLQGTRKRTPRTKEAGRSAELCCQEIPRENRIKCEKAQERRSRMPTRRCGGEPCLGCCAESTPTREGGPCPSGSAPATGSPHHKGELYSFQTKLTGRPMGPVLNPQPFLQRPRPASRCTGSCK